MIMRAIGQNPSEAEIQVKIRPRLRFKLQVCVIFCFGTVFEMLYDSVRFATQRFDT
jgi:hypothetical protein